MSLHDHFAHTTHPGFTRSVDPRSASRQFRVSLGVTIVLAVAIAGSTFAIRPSSGFDAGSQAASFEAVSAVNHHPINADARILVNVRG